MIWQKILANHLKFADRQLQTIIDVYKVDKAVDKYINTIIDSYIQLYREHNYSKYHIENSPKIARLSQDYHKILTTKKHKNRHKQHSIIIAIYIESNNEKISKKIISRMIYSYRYNYRALHIDVSRET